MVTKDAPVNGVISWIEYNEWISNKGQKGEFKGKLDRISPLDGTLCNAVVTLEGEPPKFPKTQKNI